MANQKNKGTQKDISHKDPSVGIFWVYKARLLTDGIILSKVTVYGDFRMRDQGHDAVWEAFHQSRTVPNDLNYADPPRGRVVYNAKLSKFRVFADLHILKNPRMVQAIKCKFNLPVDAEFNTDSHYRCKACLRSQRRNEL